MRHSRRLLFHDDTVKLELLRTPIRNLSLKFPGEFLGPVVRRFHRDLEKRGILLRPNLYLSNEYGTVYGTANVAVPFYDADARLQELYEEAHGLRNSRLDILNLFRHEMGHVFCYAYKLYRTPEFRRLFNVRGHFFLTYPETDRYVPNPWSKDFVNTVGDHYAQKHPDDDFAETFAEFLKGDGWKRRYRAKPGALRKLRYVARVVREWGKKAPLVRNEPRNLDLPFWKIRQTVGEFLRAPIRSYHRRALGYIDTDLRTIFRARRRSTGWVAAADVVRKHRRSLVSSACGTSGIAEGVAQDIVDKIETRLGALDLGLPRVEVARVLLGVAAYIGSLATRFSLRRSFRLPRLRA